MFYYKLKLVNKQLSGLFNSYWVSVFKIIKNIQSNFTILFDCRLIFFAFQANTLLYRLIKRFG